MTGFKGQSPMVIERQTQLPELGSIGPVGWSSRWLSLRGQFFLESFLDDTGHIVVQPLPQHRRELLIVC